jgi:hypothetical protein
MYYKTDKDLEHNGVIELRDVKSIILKASISSKPARGDLISFSIVIENSEPMFLQNFLNLQLCVCCVKFY